MKDMAFLRFQFLGLGGIRLEFGKEVLLKLSILRSTEENWLKLLQQ